MGAIISAKCACGYESTIQVNASNGLITAGYDEAGELLIGNGMNTPGTYYYPALCRSCEEAVPVNLEASSLRCPVCKGRKIVPYYDAELAREKGNLEIPYSTVRTDDQAGQEIESALYEDTAYLCPACRQFGLKFKNEGLWD